MLHIIIIERTGTSERTLQLVRIHPEWNCPGVGDVIGLGNGKIEYYRVTSRTFVLGSMPFGSPITWFRMRIEVMHVDA